MADRVMVEAEGDARNRKRAAMWELITISNSSWLSLAPRP